MQRSLLFMQILPSLRQRGLSDIVVNASVVLHKVREAVGKGAAIGFMIATPVDAKAFKPAPLRYVRYCITADAVEIQDLGPQAAVDQAIFRFRRELLAGGMAEKSGASLAAMLLQNLPEAVSSAHHWIVDPDGALALLPFEALPDEKGHMLLVNHEIRYVTSLVQLVELAPPPAAQGPACVLANPTYPSPAKRDVGSASIRLTEGSLRSGRVAIAPLPDTAEEGHSVARLLRGIGWEVTHMEAAAATAQSLMELKAPPRLLHVASHAVFLDSGVSQNDAEKAKRFVGDAILDMVLPGRRAALVLAGEDAPSVVLAKDFNRLPLRGTQLAVLSACDTGSGDVEMGEGLSGLRRALEQAGVASSVTSLWPVPSLATTALMTGFYQRLAQGLTKSHALQLAKQDLMKSGAPPHAWAGFLLSGSDAPLIHTA
jgi:CHAT domain-containing protein